MKIMSRPSVERLRRFHNDYVEKREAERFAFAYRQECLSRLRYARHDLESYHEAAHAAEGRKELHRLSEVYARADRDLVDADARLRSIQRNARLPTTLWQSAREYARANTRVDELPADLREALQ